MPTQDLNTSVYKYQTEVIYISVFLINLVDGIITDICNAVNKDDTNCQAEIASIVTFGAFLVLKQTIPVTWTIYKIYKYRQRTQTEYISKETDTRDGHRLLIQTDINAINKVVLEIIIFWIESLLISTAYYFGENFSNSMEELHSCNGGYYNQGWVYERLTSLISLALATLAIAFLEPIFSYTFKIGGYKKVKKSIWEPIGLVYIIVKVDIVYAFLIDLVQTFYDIETIHFYNISDNSFLSTEPTPPAACDPGRIIFGVLMLVTCLYIGWGSIILKLIVIYKRDRVTTRDETPNNIYNKWYLFAIGALLMACNFIYIPTDQQLPFNYLIDCSNVIDISVKNVRVTIDVLRGIGGFLVLLLYSAVLWLAYLRHLEL